MHKLVRKSVKEIKPGEAIFFDGLLEMMGDDSGGLVKTAIVTKTRKRGDGGAIYFNYWYKDPHRPVMQLDGKVDWRLYKHSLVYTYDCIEHFSPDRSFTVWTECEKHYGIDHEGSEPDCVMRQVALKALKGDGIALDIIRQGLGL